MILGKGVFDSDAANDLFGPNLEAKPAIAVWLLSKAVDPDFQQQMKIVFGSTTGAIRSAPSKGIMRMIEKIKEDHKDELNPKPCANIDGRRLCPIACMH